MMFRLACVLSLLGLAAPCAFARHTHHVALADATLKISVLQFTVPAAWLAESPETSARAAQWLVPVPESSAVDPVQVVVFFFGPGVGGTVKQTIEGWAATITSPSPPSSPPPQKRTTGGHAISEVLLTGTYTEPGLEPGLPPAAHPGYALWGAVLENGGGNLYWRATGPAAQVAALAPVLDRMLDSVKPIPVAPSPAP
jgi:hypothetical protein